jgi:translocation and assembly module TamB
LKSFISNLWQRKWLRISGYIGLGLVSSLLLIIILLQVPFVQKQIALNLSQTLSDEEVQIKISPIKGFFPFTIYFDEFSIADKQGLWLKLQQAQLSWSFSALLMGKIRIDELSLKQLWIKRLPSSKEKPKEADAVIEIPTSLPELNLDLPIINVRHIGIDEIKFEKVVIGQSLTLNLTAEAHTVGQEINAKLQLKRTDQASLNLNFDALIYLNPLKITTTLHVDETGGLLALLSLQPELKNLQLDLKATGLVSDLKIDLKTKLDGLGELNTQVKLGISEQPWLNLQSAIQLQTGLLPKDIVDLLGVKQQLNINLVATDSQNVQLKQFSFKNSLVTLNSNANVNLSSQEINAKIDLKLAQLEKLNALAGMKLSGVTNLQLAINGLFTEPQISLNTAIENLKIDDFSLQALKLKLQLTPLKTLADEQFKIALQGIATDLKQQGESLPESNLSWQLAATFDEKQRLDLKKFQLDGQWSHLQLVGIFDSVKQQGDFNLKLNLDNLKAVTTAVDAKVKTDMQIKIHPKIKKIELALNTDVLQLVGLDESVNKLVGKQVQLKSQIEVKPENYINVKQLRIKANALNLQANTRLNLKNQQLKGKVQVNLPSFKTNDLSLKQAKITLGINGTTEKPSLNLLATVPILSVAGQKLQTIKLQATANDVIENLQGKLDLNLSHQAQPLTLSTHYALKNEQLKLNSILIKASKTELKGQLAVNLSNTLIKGKLSASSDLTGLKPWLEQAMQGKLTLNTELKPIKGKQFVQLKTQLKQFKMDQLSFANLKLNAAIKNALDQPNINATLTLDKLKQGETQLKQLKFVASGILEQLKLKLTAKGKHQQPFNLALTALLKQTDQQTQLELQKITGKALKQKINLIKMTALTITPKKITLSPLSLFFGKAHLQGQVNYSEKLLAGSLQLGLPLSWVNELADTALKGQFNTNIQLSGTAKQPQIDLAVNLNDLGLKEEDFEKLPATQIALKAQIKNQQLQANLDIKNAQFKKPLHADLKLPMQLQLAPFVFELPENKTLQGKFIADLSLEDLVKNIPFEGQKLAGTFNTNLHLTGTIKNPELHGRIALKQGEYQNATTETHLKNIQLQVDAEPKKIILTKLSLEDTETGNIKGKGLFSLIAKDNNPFSGELNFNHIQLANSPQLKTHLSGELKVKGNSKQALLSGKLNIDDFSLTIPSASSQDDIPEMEVTEIGRNFPTEKQQEIKKAEVKDGFKMNLDIGLKIANQFYIKGYGLDSEWQGDLSIKGGASMPKVLGLIQTKRGSLEILNNRFVFRQGLIYFNGAYPPLPSLNIEAVASSDEGGAIIRIKGMADNPQLELSHDPHLPQDEILSGLLFKEKTKSISPMQAIQLAEVVTMLASGGLENIDTLGSLQTGLGLDRLNLGGDNFDTVSVKAGKYITDKIYLEVEQGLQSESSTATVEVDLLPDIKAEVEFNQASDSSVGIKWKHDY